MRILVLSQYFPPETGGPQNRLASLAVGLRDRGHEVTVVTAKPNYPSGVVFDGYEDGWVVESDYEGIPVAHTWVLTDREKTTARRILFYLSFVVSAVLASIPRVRDADVVLASSPPLPVGLAGWAVSRLGGAGYVFDVRDLWPDVAVAMGQLSDGWIARAARFLERFIYRGADGITAVTEGFCRDIRQRVGPATPVIRISNGTDPDVFRVETPRTRLRQELALPEGFLAVYAGNIGLAQGLGHLVRAAAILDAEEVSANILLVGDGPLRAELQAAARDRGIERLRFRDRVPLEEAARYLAASDASLVPLGDHPIYRKFIPSKLFDSMAAARPVLLSVAGEAREILEDAGAGLYYPAEDARGLVEGIQRLMADSRRDEMGRRGREYVAGRFTRQAQAREMAKFVEKLTGKEASNDG